ncbi:MAG: RNA methyltransferase [Clostridia bacterium]|nr:RNA methyltransferase [Clostridia bacterium]
MRDKISSKSNASIKYTKKLLSSASFRKKEKSFLLEGVRLCADALKSGIKFKTIFYTEKCREKFPEIINSLIEKSENSFETTEEIIKLISDTDTPQGIVCICETPSIIGKNGEYSDKLVMLENIQNPSNLGSIFRTCDALGVKNVIISGDSCDVYNPKVLRGSMGAVFRLNIKICDDFRSRISECTESGYKVYATVPSNDAEKLGIGSLLSGKSAVVFGNEGNGITPETIDLCTHKLTIPMAKNAESLNVAVAAGIVIWELMK